MSVLQADKYGTPSEQARHRALWVGPGIRQTHAGYEPNRRCKSCRHFGGKSFSIISCRRHGFRTQSNAVCASFERLAS